MDERNDSDDDKPDYKKSRWGWEETLPLKHPSYRWWSTFGSQVEDLQEKELVVLAVDNKWMAGEVTRITGSGHIVFQVYGTDSGNPWRVVPGWRKPRSKETLYAETNPGKP